MSWLGRIEKATAQFVDRVFTKLTGVESPHPGLRLRMMHGIPSGAEFVFDHTVTVGRGEENDIVLGDPSVSRHHARIELDAHGATVKDLESTNGTFVNAERVAAHVIAAGDVLRFGNSELHVEA